MTKWRIHPSGVHDVLMAVRQDNDTLGEVLTEAVFEEVYNGLDWAPAMTKEVSKAVDNLLSDQSTNVENIANRINAGLVGVSNAVIAYDNGQEEMAGTYQTELLKSAKSGDFSYFVEHGHQS